MLEYAFSFPRETYIIKNILIQITDKYLSSLYNSRM